MERPICDIHAFVQFQIAQRQREQSAEFLKNAQIVATKPLVVAASDKQESIDRIRGAARCLRERDKNVARAVNLPLYAPLIACEARESFRALHQVDTAELNRLHNAV